MKRLMVMVVAASTAGAAAAEDAAYCEKLGSMAGHIADMRQSGTPREEAAQVVRAGDEPAFRALVLDLINRAYQAPVGSTGVERSLEAQGFRDEVRAECGRALRSDEAHRHQYRPGNCSSKGAALPRR